MSVATSLRSLRSCMTITTQDLVRGCEIITTRYDDGEVFIVTRRLLHGPFPPKVYRVVTYSEGEDCLPYIAEERWCLRYNGIEEHPWLDYSWKSRTSELILNNNNWGSDKESLRPQLIKALRTWHTKLTAELAAAEEALVDALFKPL